MIRKIISTLGIIGVIAMIVVSIIDHLTFMEDKPYFIAMGVGFVLFVPMLIRDLISPRPKKKED